MSPRPLAALAPKGTPAKPSLLSAAGLRSTPQRRAIIEEITAAPGHLSSGEIFERLEVRGAGLDRSTAYRALAQLCKAGVLAKVSVGLADGALTVVGTCLGRAKS